MCCATPLLWSNGTEMDHLSTFLPDGCYLMLLTLSDNVDNVDNVDHVDHVDMLIVLIILM